MATKTKTVRVAVVHNDQGHYAAGGLWEHGERPDDASLIAEARTGLDAGKFPHACIVEIELPISEPLKITVRKVKAVKT